MYPGQSSSPLLSCFSLHETPNENIAVGIVLAARNIFENPDLNLPANQQQQAKLDAT